VCLANYLNEVGFETKVIEFMKFDFNYSFLNNWLQRCALTSKFSAYAGIWARKKETSTV